MSDVLGQAIYDHHHQARNHKLWIHNRYGDKEEMPVETYFRDEDDMPDLEWLALNECRGSVLDIGAGAGSHALVLQQRGFDVAALEISPLAAAVMRERGVNNVIEADIFNYSAQRYDTLLLLMNGIGLTGTLQNLRMFLRHAKTLLLPGGQLLFDSSDVAYIYEGDLPADRYHGEILYEYQYKNKKSGWFSWLYADENTLLKLAAEEGWNAEVLLEDEFNQYLVRLKPVS
ncbi:MAG: methyltransferase domain-containing protein [Sphingobacteriaceae bacterium]|nr:MAG: methyltransferase domain-containing protein [Sphingobacteriaceae bacterium]